MSNILTNFNYLKFHAIISFVQSIWHYNNKINHDITYSKTAHKFFFKISFKKINEKKYKL